MIYDVAIIGAGAMGMSAGYYLSKNNQKVLLIDKYSPPHNMGSHNGGTRTFRCAYGEGEKYVPMLIDAQKLWEDLEKDSNEELFIKTGALNVGYTSSIFIKNVLETAENYQLPVEVLNAKEINNRWPGLKVQDEQIGCFEKNSGILKSDDCIKAYKRLAQKHGAQLSFNTTVKKIEPGKNSTLLLTDKGHFQSKKIIITAGSRCKELLQEMNIPIKATRKSLAWFKLSTDTCNNIYPALSLETEKGFYYSTILPQQNVIKIGKHEGGEIIKSLDEIEPFNYYDSDLNDLKYFLNLHIKDTPQFIEGQTCMYTNSPDNDFIIDKLPQEQNTYIATGFSGHGFKFSSVIGQILSNMILDKPVPYDLTPFSLKRFEDT